MRKFLVLVLALVPQLAFGGFFNSEKETGWFWKKEPREEKKEEKREKKIAVKQTPARRSKPEEKLVNKDAQLLLQLPETITEEELDKLTPKQVGRLWELYYERALWRPNEKDYENLLRIQNYAIRKSQLHFVAMLDVLRKHPEWNPNVKKPIQTFGRRVNFIAKEQEIRDYLSRYKDRAGLYFFFESSCKFCKAQAQVLKIFQKLYGWSVLPISVDGACLPEYPNCQPDTRMLASRLGIKAYPAIFLVIPKYKNGKPLIQPVAYGLVPMDELKRTIYFILYSLENGHPPEVEKKEWEQIKEAPPKKAPELPKELKGVASVLNQPRQEISKEFDNQFWGER